jgi:hypothetical protein
LRADVADGADKAMPCPERDLHAEVMDRFALDGTDGPVDHGTRACRPLANCALRKAEQALRRDDERDVPG